MSWSLVGRYEQRESLKGLISPVRYNMMYDRTREIISVAFMFLALGLTVVLLFLAQDTSAFKWIFASACFCWLMHLVSYLLHGLALVPVSNYRRLNAEFKQEYGIKRTAAILMPIVGCVIAVVGTAFSPSSFIVWTLWVTMFCNIVSSPVYVQKFKKAHECIREEPA